MADDPNAPVEKRDADPDPIKKIRTKEPQAPFGADEPNPNVVGDTTAAEKGAGEADDPGLGGYADRDPKTDMPGIPSEPETQGDPPTHGGDPDDPRERNASD